MHLLKVNQIKTNHSLTRCCVKGLKIRLVLGCFNTKQKQHTLSTQQHKHGAMKTYLLTNQKIILQCQFRPQGRYTQ